MNKTAFETVPKIAYWRRTDFLAARDNQYLATLKKWEQMGKPSTWIVCEPPEEIICDDCNAEVLGLDINVVQYGRRCVCDRCFDQYLPGGPLGD